MTPPSKTVLIVDDERETLTLLRLALRKAGYLVITAASWDEVADRVQKTYQNGGVIDAIVLDLMMPGRSGFDIMRSLQVALDPTPPVVMLSAVTGFDQQVEARELGIARYLTKPTTPAKLIDAIEAVLADHHK